MFIPGGLGGIEQVPSRPGERSFRVWTLRVKLVHTAIVAQSAAQSVPPPLGTPLLHATGVYRTLDSALSLPLEGRCPCASDMLRGPLPFTMRQGLPE
eukprot:5340840-Amphidinium_carterae.1